MKFSVIILLTFLLNALVFNSNAQKRKGIPPEKPTLIIGIVIEDMRYDYMQRYWNNFSEGGFKRLMDEGTYCKDARYNYLLTQTSAGLATIATGTNPSIHGIVADQWYQQMQDKMQKSVTDPNAKPLADKAGQEHFNSPKNLLTSTFTDELKLFNHQQSNVISIALTPEAAVLPGGHMANYAFWFNFDTGNWLSGKYYADSLPQWVNDFNNKKYPDIYLLREWTPMLALEKYRMGSSSGSSKLIGFDSENQMQKKLNTLLKKETPYSKLAGNPYGNNIVKDFAIATIVDAKLGADEFTDYLSVCFSATANVSKVCGPNSIELEDMYLRLDKELEHFLAFIDENLEKQNVLIYLTSDHGTAYNPTELEKTGIPAGTFNADRAVMLLSTYLNAVYGKGKWVSQYFNKQIYLNHQLIEDSKLKLTDVQDVVAKFMIQFTGVSNALTASALESANFTDGIFAAMQNSFNQKRSGDVVINLDPGWIEEGPFVTSANSANRYDTHVPLIWYGWKIKRSQITRHINLTDIAPTLSHFLDIPFPNGCTGTIITELD